MQMKQRMGLYTIALLLCKIVWNWIEGLESVKSIDIVTIWAACLLFSMLETAILPKYEYSPVRTACWAITANIIFGTGALWAGWFRGIPILGSVILFGILELALVMVWFGDNIAMKADTAQLNRQLKDFQCRQKEKEDSTSRKNS